MARVVQVSDPGKTFNRRARAAPAVRVGSIAYVPVQLLRRFSLPLPGLLLFAIGGVFVAWLVFRAGPGRYESGNLVLMRD